jgi:UV DNA damage endonuclease
MRIRFGYVAMAINLKDSTPSKTVTATNLEKIEDKEARIIKLKSISKENLNNTLRILKHNVGYGIKVYRFTSKLIPLSTHPIAAGWDYVNDLRDEFKAIGDFVKENALRVSLHPDHFTILNSPKEDVLKAAIKDLIYHENILEAMELDNTAKVVLHIGGLYKNKEASIERFIVNFRKLDSSLRSRIVLENDDKVYTAEDVLGISSELGVPMVLDIHHDRCNRSSNEISHYIGPIFKTWDNDSIPPKIHLSSPKDEKGIRNHADFIEKGDFLEFLYKSKEIGKNYDVMIEAKSKNMAVHKLLEDIKDVPGIQVVSEGEIIY